MALRNEIIKYNSKLKEHARYLRNHSTIAEIKLWNYLKQKQMRGYDFHRQKPIGNYIVDFYSPELRLVIEIDGLTHDYKIEKDKLRQENIEQLNINILRFSHSQVMRDINAVLRVIDDWIKTTHPNPSPSQSGQARGE